jgi:hypothetical protein
MPVMKALLIPPRREIFPETFRVLNHATPKLKCPQLQTPLQSTLAPAAYQFRDVRNHRHIAFVGVYQQRVGRASGTIGRFQQLNFFGLTRPRD